MTFALPCVLLSYQSSVYASFAPLPLLNGSTSNPKDVFFVDDHDLFNGSIDDFIFAIQRSLNIKSDILLTFQDMELDLHSDSYMTGQISLAEIHKIYSDKRLVQNYIKIPPLKVKIIEMASCFKMQLVKLKMENLEALKDKKDNPYLNRGDCENPISIEDDGIVQNFLVDDDDVIVIDDDGSDRSEKQRQKITRPYVKRTRKTKRIFQLDVRGSSSVLRFT